MCSLAPLNVKSQEKFTALFYKDGDESLEIISILRDMSNLSFQDAGATKFAIVDKNNNFALGIGGQARFVAGSEFGGIIASSTNQGFQPSLIPIPTGTNPNSQVRMSAATSQIYVKMVGKTRKLGNIETFVSINFQGDNYAPVLRQAYVKLGSFEFGKTWSSLTDVSALPPTIDYAGPVSVVAVRNPLIRYSLTTYNKKNVMAISAEFPQVNGTYSENTASQYQPVPDVIGYYQFNWGEKRDNHFRVAGIGRYLAYKDLVTSTTKYEKAFGAQLSAAFMLNDCMKFYGQGIVGKGIASYLTDISTQNLDLLPNVKAAGYCDKLGMWGASGGLQCNILENLFVSSTYSYSRVYNNHRVDMSSDSYKYSQYIVANAFWNITKDCTLGVEYLRGMKTEISGAMGHSNRANFLVQYAF